MTFQSFSQAGQDRFVYEVLIKTGLVPHGTFLDIGSGDPVNGNNTVGLENLGWTGTLVDRVYRPSSRTAVVLTDDATTMKVEWLPPKIDYLSLDVDTDTVKALGNILRSGTRFKILTVEHDKYHLGPEPQKEIRAMLSGEGYSLVCADVGDKNLPFEDWWVDPQTVPVVVYEKFFSDVGKNWQEIFQQAGVIP